MGFNEFMGTEKETETLKEELNDERSFSNRLVIYILVFVFISSTFEISLLLIAYFYSDRVECNLLWCTFTIKEGSEHIISNSIVNVTSVSTSTCYLNGNLINCSDLDNYYP
ncbi:hypothetical protein M0R04_09075 [Candidatus Dojkabacteria bacterium]|jgi:hypothetical protein|nr:hypothetical protein [Candidatus Dojkabacteria bacterium]